MSAFFQNLTGNPIVQLDDLLTLSERPIPEAPDGQYDNEAEGQSIPYSRLHNVLARVGQDMQRLTPVSLPDPITVMKGFLNFCDHPDSINDRYRIFNDALAAVSDLNPGKDQREVNNVVVTALYNTLTHPPATFLGKQFRTADGSYNSLGSPELGKAFTNYAKSVQGKQPQPPNMLPDAGLVFDTLLRAESGSFVQHPNGNSALTFAFASLVTHSLFKTDLRNQNQNNTSSYLDLSPLYGCDQVSQDVVRDKEKGRGLLYPDTFSEDRLLVLPPAVSALLVIFCRNHNYIANMLLKINERKQWLDPPPADEQKKAQQDEEIFQTARLVNCGHFMSMIVADYLGGFLGMASTGNAWTLDLFDIIKSPTGGGCPRGQGNHVSVEFNLLYRWHALLSKSDIDWTNKEFQRIFNKPFDQLNLNDFIGAYKDVFKNMESEPSKRTFGDLKRQEDHTFKDEDLASLLQNATESPAGAYRARGIPECFRIIEILTIEQARNWGVCTLNEFRDFLGLKKLTSFKQWNRDESVAEAAMKLYSHIDNLELYPGLIAEETIPLGPGSGICCGYTMTRAILGDAVALVRGDRYYTTDFTPANLTSWGFQDCARDPNNGAFGAALPKLLFRHLPNYYPANSVYGLFPFSTPQRAKENLHRLNKQKLYSFTRPIPQPTPIVLKTLTGIRHVFKDYQKYKVTYGDDMRLLTNDYGFFLVFDEKNQHDTDRNLVLRALFNRHDSISRYKSWYKEKTIQMINEKSYKYHGVNGTYIDIVQNVINLVSVHWATDILCGISLKTNENPKGIFTEQEMSSMLQLLFTCVFEDIDPEFGFTLRSTASDVSKVINKLIEQSINEAAPWTMNNPLRGVFTKISQTVWHTVPKSCEPFLSALAASDRPMNDLIACVIGLAVGSSVNFSQAVTQVVDLYLDPKYENERAHIVKLSKKDDKESADLLKGYVREAMRLNPQYAGLFRTVAKDDTIPQGPGQHPMHVRKGDLLFASFKDAHLNPTDFPDPEKIDPTRPKDSYQLQGSGFHICPGIDFAAEIIPEMIKIIFTLPNLRRAPGSRGILESFNLDQFQTKNRWYITSTGNISPWPGSLLLVYDDF